MSKLIALTACAVIVSSLAYAEEKKSESAAVEPSVEKTDAPADKRAASKAAREKQVAEVPEKIDWTKVDWRKRLTRMQYYILREAGTERAFQNKFWDFFKPGQYRCAGCGLPIFESDAKFESDCGWPSFDKTIAKDTVTEHVDYKIGYPRTEIRCRRCQSHLGHVFNDGPTNTGMRYCLNSAAMNFVNAKQLKAEKAKAESAEKATPKDDAKTEPKAHLAPGQ